MAGFENDPHDEWYEIERITNRRIMPVTRDDLLQVIEAPLRPAIGILYDKNIQTIGSSCNAVDLVRSPWITLDAESLSAENKEVADAYEHTERVEVERSGLKMVGLKFPVGEKDTPRDIGRRATTLANKFFKQPFTWAPRWTLEQARSQFFIGDIDLSNDGLSDEQVLEMLRSAGYFYDFDTGTLFASREQFRKFKNSPPLIPG